MRSVSTFKQTLKTQNKELKQNIEQTAVLGFTVEERTADNLVLKETIQGLTINSGGTTQSVR